jgi:IAA-amino acid hydrolase
MLKEGALDGIQGIFGLHVSPQMPTGTIGSRPGPFLAGAGRFLVTVQGKGGHAAAPHLTADPILAACSVILALQQIVSRETNPLEARVCIYMFGEKWEIRHCFVRQYCMFCTFIASIIEWYVDSY